MDEINHDEEDIYVTGIGRDLAPFCGASLASVMVLPLEFPAVSMWLEHIKGGPALMIAGAGERGELARWSEDLCAWDFASSADDPADADMRTLTWLPEGAEQIKDLTDAQYVEFLEATEQTRRCLLEHLSFGWKLTCELTTDQNNSPLFNLVAEPPEDIDIEAARRAATMTDYGFGVTDLTWVGPPPSRWGEEWTLSKVLINGVEVDTTPAILDGLFVIGGTIAPGWTLPPGFDRPAIRHSENGRMPESKVAVAFNTPAAIRSSEEVAHLKHTVRIWADEHQFGPTICIPRPEGTPWTSATRTQLVNAVTETLMSSGKGTAGYYLLGFENGDSYVGQSVNIAKRLASHLRERPAVDSIALLPDSEAGRIEAPLRHLLHRERRLIHSLQRDNHPSRNKAEMTYRTGACSLDEVFDEMGFSAQEWLADPTKCNTVATQHPSRTTPESGELSTGTENMKRLAARAGDRLQPMLDIQRAYTRRCLPVPAQTELDWWVVSSPPTTPLHGTLSNLSVGWGIECLRINVDFTGWVQVNLVELFGDNPTDEDFLRFMRQHPGSWFDDAPYKDGGAFNANLRASNLDVLADLLDDTAVTRAAATAALNYMRASKMAAQKRSHNAVLARLITD